MCGPYSWKSVRSSAFLSVLAAAPPDREPRASETSRAKDKTGIGTEAVRSVLQLLDAGLEPFLQVRDLVGCLRKLFDHLLHLRVVGGEVLHELACEVLSDAR